MDSLVGFYRLKIRNRKWYHRIFQHLLDVVCCQAWLLYRLDFDKLHKPTKKKNKKGEAKREHMGLWVFKSRISQSLRYTEMDPSTIKRKGRPRTQDRPPHKGRKPSKKDKSNVEYHPELRYVPGPHRVKRKARQTCRYEYCPVLRRPSILTYYDTCGVHLCIRNDRNCFYNWH